jgi:hypothetical protein
MSLPAPSYAIQVDPKWNNVPEDAIEVVAASGSPAVVEQEVILWDSISEKDQQFVLDVVDNAGGWPVADLSAELDSANSQVPTMTLPATFRRPAAPVNVNLAYYDGSWKYVYDDSAVV